MAESKQQTEQLIAERNRLANIVNSHEAQIVSMAAERAELIQKARAVTAPAHGDDRTLRMAISDLRAALAGMERAAK